VSEKMANFSQETDIPALMEEAQRFLDHGDPESAVQLLRRGADISKNTPDIFDLLAEVEMSIGETENAARAWMHVIEQSGNPDDISHAERWLYIAQLQEGEKSRESYLQGIKLLQARAQTNPEQYQTQLCTAFCALAELYLTDLCFEENAEEACQTALDQAMTFDNTESHEPVQGLASLRLSQNRHADACQLMQVAYERITVSSEDIDGELRLTSCRLLLECAPHQPSLADAALDLLSGLMQEDDENVEVWFMMGVGFYQQSPPDVELSKEYLLEAKGMLDKIKSSVPVTEFPYQAQLQLIEEQLTLVDSYVEVEP